MKVGANPTHDAYVASWKDRVPADPCFTGYCGFSGHDSQKWRPNLYTNLSQECSPTSKNSPLSDAGRVSPDGGTLAPAVALSWCWPPAQEDEDGRPAASAVARGCILVWCRASPGEGGAPASVVSMVRCWLVDRGGAREDGRNAPSVYLASQLHHDQRERRELREEAQGDRGLRWTGPTLRAGHTGIVSNNTPVGMIKERLHNTKLGNALSYEVTELSLLKNVVIS
ncbi:unnamed protein product [Ranitomeya imitator]|uniref:Uncharacterized protein n=1 Tax=Ranitomeya imitator TaxID=111125 RepID=A0ABN9M8A9_9NEOB|nr:unnamed protein product [Ranitomeya imitator]